MPFNYKHPAYLAARAECFRRSNGQCQMCGVNAAEVSMHWAWVYPPASSTTANDLTALCRGCFDDARELRSFLKHGGDANLWLRCIRSARGYFKRLARASKLGELPRRTPPPETPLSQRRLQPRLPRRGRFS